MMVYPEEPSIWSIPHIPALYDDDGDYGGKKKKKKFKIAALIPPKLQQLHSRSAGSPDEWIVALDSLICPRNSQSLTQLRAERKMKKVGVMIDQIDSVLLRRLLTHSPRAAFKTFFIAAQSLRWKCGNRRKKRNGRENGGSEDWMDFGRRQMDSSDWLW